MAKKRKIFKQKIRQILQEAERSAGVAETKKRETKQIKENKEPQREPQKESSPLPVSSIISLDIVLKDLRKISVIFGIILVLLAAVAIVSLKTTWLASLADKIYSQAQLGS